jgi:exosortase A-associated hydrolase 2
MTFSAAAGAPAGRFLDTPRGRIFCRYTPAQNESCLIVVPPFAEEMNRCRRMWTLLAVELAAAGIGMLVPDLHGTGESDGDFAEARWDSWRDDLDVTCRFAHANGMRRIALLGVRLGGLLTLDYLQRGAFADAHIAQLILWQPVIDGRQHINQFLRLKLAAGMRQGETSRETTATLRERLARGDALEVAGYELAPQLIAAIDALDGKSLAPTGIDRGAWLEVSTLETPSLAPASVRTLEAWRGAGVDIDAQAVRGEPFWSLQEITIAPELLTVTRDLAIRALQS